MNIKRSGLVISTTDKLYDSKGSGNVPITVSVDSSTTDLYSGYTTEMHFGYVSNGVLTEGIATYSSGSYLIPSQAFANKGYLYIALHLIKSNEIRATNQLAFVIKSAPNGTEVMPSELDWQSIIDNYCNEKLALYAKKSDVDSMDAKLQSNIDSEASTRKSKDDALDDRIDNIIAQSGTSDTEVVDARNNEVEGKTYNTLHERLDEEYKQISLGLYVDEDGYICLKEE